MLLVWSTMLLVQSTTRRKCWSSIELAGVSCIQTIYLEGFHRYLSFSSHVRLVSYELFLPSSNKALHLLSVVDALVFREDGVGRGVRDQGTN
jgi:hypothetical protein